LGICAFDLGEKMNYLCKCKFALLACIIHITQTLLILKNNDYV